MKHAIFALLTILSMPLQNAHAWGRFDGGIHPDYDRRYHRDPVIIHREYIHEHRGGCIGCGAAAVVGLVGGAIIGASLAQPEYHETVVVQQAPPTVVYAPPPPPYGSQFAQLPGACSNMNINGQTFYRCNQDWYQPFMGGNGVYYTLVPPPM